MSTPHLDPAEHNPIDEDVNTAAIRAARAVGSATLLAADRLNAPLEDEAENW